MSDSDIHSITTDLDLSTAIAGRDKTISELQGRVSELEASFNSANEVAQGAMRQVAELQTGLNAKTAELMQMSAHLAKVGAPAAPTGPRVKLTAPHGFIDETTGRNLFWTQGEVATDPTVIDMLKTRGAPVEDF